MQMECYYYFCVLFTLSVITLNAVNGQQSRQLAAGYRIPQPTAAVLSPRGFRISIPGTDTKQILLISYFLCSNFREKMMMCSNIRFDSHTGIELNVAIFPRIVIGFF